MDITHEPETYKETLLFLSTAGIVVPLFHRLKISPVLGFLGAGAALGPFGLGRLATTHPWLDPLTISRLEPIAHIADLGVVFLLFMIGLELSWERLSRMRHLVFGMGTAQVLASAIVLALAARWLGASHSAAVVLGGALALSSTAIVIPVLAESKRLRTPAGRASFAVLLLQDLAVAPLLVMVSIIGARTSHVEFDVHALYALAPAAAALLLLVLAGRKILRPLFRLVAQARSTELFTAACLFVVIAAGTLAARSGLSMGLGAFVAGLLLAETEFRREIEVTIEPFRGLLLGLFFVSVGASLDLNIVAENPWQLVGLALALVVVKATIIVGLGRLFRLPWVVGAQVGLLLGAGGEFGFVLLGSAAGEVLPHRLAETAFVVVTLSMVAIPALAWLGERLGRQVHGKTAPVEDAEPPPDDEVARVIIVGYGRVGRLVGDMLRRHDFAYLCIDSDLKLVASERGGGKAIYYGDATRVEFLRRCGIAHAQALVVTMDVPPAVEAVVAAARGERPDLTIVARARDTRHAMQLYTLGVTDAVPETIEASLQLSEAVLVDLGVPMGFVIASIHEKRDEFRKQLTSGEIQPRRLRATRSRPGVRRERSG